MTVSALSLVLYGFLGFHLVGFSQTFPLPFDLRRWLLQPISYVNPCHPCVSIEMPHLDHRRLLLAVFGCFYFREMSKSSESIYRVAKGKKQSHLLAYLQDSGAPLRKADGWIHGLSQPHPNCHQPDVLMSIFAGKLLIGS